MRYQLLYTAKQLRVSVLLAPACLVAIAAFTQCSNLQVLRFSYRFHCMNAEYRMQVPAQKKFILKLFKVCDDYYF